MGAPCPIIDPYIPVNAKKIRVQGASTFSAGDLVQIAHPSTKEWIEGWVLTILAATVMDQAGAQVHAISIGRAK